MEYPEHEKLTVIKEKSQLLGEFLEWARSSNYEFCNRVVIDKGSAWEKVEYQPNRAPIEKILADFYEIDLTKLEFEKQQMLATIKGE